MKRNSFGLYRVEEIRRTRWRDGSHPEPGTLVREERVSRLVRLRVPEVRKLGLVGALCREELKKLSTGEKLSTFE